MHRTDSADRNERGRRAPRGARGDGAERTTAVIICRDDAHAFLLESVLDGEVDRVIHVDGPRRAIELIMRGLEPELVLLDVDLFEVPGDTAAAAGALRVIAGDAVVLEVGERLARSGDELAARLRGNSVEARDWATLRP